MKISIDTLRWMNHQYKTTGEIMPDGIDTLVEKIGAQLGAVEEVIDLGKRYHGIVIAKVVSCIKHPDADKLSLCKIDDGGIVKKIKRDKDGYIQVVCGAPNVRKDLLVAWLPPGITVPASFDKDPFVLETREIRGQMSNGMLASSHELGLSDDHTGILEIADDFNPGTDFADAYGLGGHVVDIENKMFTHRPDCFGWLGIARELAGIQQMAFKSPSWYTPNPKLPKMETAEYKFKVKNSVPKLVPRFTAIAMGDVQVANSPTWVQVELAKVGSRPINSIVDLTNLFMLETGQPLHAYDADKLPAPSLETRMSRKGEKLKLLNGKEITFEDSETVLITSGEVPVGIGGVMGGADTEVDETTKNIIIECANFDMYNIRRTSMKYGLFTDAVTRFNKGQSPRQNLAVLAKILDEIRKTGSGKVASGAHDDNHAQDAPKTVRVGVQFINSRLGLKLSSSEMQKLLENVEFSIARTDNKDELKVTPPFWRTDIEIPEDVVEEVGRLYGYDNLPLELPKRDITPATKSPLIELKNQLRQILSRAGANEVLTYSFVHGNLLEKVGQDRSQAFQLTNALSPDLQYYRLGLTPSLLEKIHPNVKAGYDAFALFEIGKAHVKGQIDPDEPAVPKEFENLALIYTASDKLEQPGTAYFQARHFLDYVALSLGVRLRYEPLTEPPTYQAAMPYDYQRSARVYAGDKLIGLVGEFKASVRQALKLPKYTAGFEIAITSERFTRTFNSYHPLSKYPSVEQDISLKVPADLPYAQLHDFVWENLAWPEHSRPQLEPIDIYQGKDKKTKNITLRLTIASYEKTMTDAEVNKLLDDVAAKAKAKFGAERL